jgi:hypothetical protein
MASPCDRASTAPRSDRRGFAREEFDPAASTRGSHGSPSSCLRSCVSRGSPADEWDDEPVRRLPEELEDALPQQRRRLLVVLSEEVWCRDRRRALLRALSWRAPARSRSPRRPRECAAAGVRRPATSPARCRPTSRAPRRNSRGPRHSRPAVSKRATELPARRRRDRHRKGRLAATQPRRERARPPPSALRASRSAPSHLRTSRTSCRRKGRAYARCGQRRATHRRNGGRDR